MRVDNNQFQARLNALLFKAKHERVVRLDELRPAVAMTPRVVPPPVPKKIRRMVRGARKRATKAGLPFSITWEDVQRVWPTDGRCPILGTPFSDMEENPDRWRRASLDRLRPHDGYVAGNIAIISLRANSLKSNVTDSEIFRRLADWMDEAAPTVEKLFS